MDPRQLCSLLARQIDAARHTAILEEPEPRSPTLVPALLRSLRLTYLAVSSGLDPRSDALNLFVLDVGENRALRLLQGGSPIPINDAYLRELFNGAGIELLPGQAILLEPEAAQDVIDEALRAIALDHALAEREKVQRNSALQEALAIPPESAFAALEDLEKRMSSLWERKIELVAARLVADELLERARALQAHETP